MAVEPEHRPRWTVQRGEVIEEVGERGDGESGDSKSIVERE